MKTRLFLLFALSLVLFSCEENGDEPWNPNTKDVTILARCIDSNNTVFVMSTKDGVIADMVVNTEGSIGGIYNYNGQPWVWIKNGNRYQMCRFDHGNLADSKDVSFLDDYTGGKWWGWAPRVFDSNILFGGINEEDKVFMIFDSNGSPTQYPLSNINLDDYKTENGSFSRSTFYAIDGYSNFFCANLINNEKLIVEKNGQKLWEDNCSSLSRIEVVGQDLYVLGSYNGKGAYWVNGRRVVDDKLSAISSVCSLNGTLCLGGYTTDEHKVQRATMKVGDRYYDLTDELDWYGYRDPSTGEGLGKHSCVVKMIVENNEIFAQVTKYNQVSPYLAGDGVYVMPHSDAIFRNDRKVMDMGDKRISSFAVITQE